MRELVNECLILRQLHNQIFSIILALVISINSHVRHWHSILSNHPCNFPHDLALAITIAIDHLPQHFLLDLQQNTFEFGAPVLLYLWLYLYRVGGLLELFDQEGQHVGLDERVAED